MPNPSIIFASFATKGDSKYRDYSARIFEVQQMIDSLESEVILFDQLSLRTINTTEIERLYLSCRRGAGYWFWKPVILLNLVERYPSSFIVYFDIDVDILCLPPLNILTSVHESSSGFGAYLTDSELRHWTKKSLLKNIEIEEVSCIYEASVLLVDASHVAVLKTLNLWRDKMQDPTKLLDDLFDFQGRHRHDQTILNIAKYTREIEIQDIGKDFWCKPEGVATQGIRLDKRAINLLSVLFHKFQLFIFLLRYNFFVFK